MSKTLKQMITDASPALPHIMVKAYAGTGKTFTGVYGVAWAWRHKIWKEVCRRVGDITPSEEQAAIWELLEGTEPRSVLYAAFNSSIVKAFSQDYDWLVKVLERVGCNLTFSTIHSLGYGICKKHYKLGYKGVNKFTTQNNLCEMAQMDYQEMRKSHLEFMNAVTNLVSKAKLTLTGWDGEGFEIKKAQILELAARFCIEIEQKDVDKVCGYTQDLLKMCIAREGDYRINFDDQLFLPVVNNLPPNRRFDLIIGDEYQDQNRCQQELITKHIGNRLIVLGDPNQAIYGWAGADVGSMSRMAERLGQTDQGMLERKLTVTRRCGKAIVERARQIVADFSAHESNPLGEVRTVNTAEGVKDYAPGDMVLCRTNAPLLAQAMRCLKERRPARIQGQGELSSRIESIIDKSKAETPESLCMYADDWENKEIKKLNKRKHVTEEAVMYVQDLADCVKMLGEECDTMEEVRRMLKQVFTFADPVILFSSMHRAKGLEADRVFIIRPDLLPHPMAESETAREQERNLEYVAVTRPKECLTFVNGS